MTAWVNGDWSKDLQWSFGDFDKKKKKTEDKTYDMIKEIESLKKEVNELKKQLKLLKNDENIIEVDYKIVDF